MSHTGASPCGLLDELHFTMLFKCKFSIVFIWMDCKCFCHLGSLWFLQTCCFYPQFPFPLTGAVSHDSDSFTPDTVCVGVSSSFPSLQAHFSVVPQKIFDHFCVGGFIFEVCLQYLLSETYVLDSGAELSLSSGAKRRSSSLNRLPSNVPQASKEVHKQPQVEKTGAKLPVLLLFWRIC